MKKTVNKLRVAAAGLILFAMSMIGYSVYQYFHTFYPNGGIQETIAKHGATVELVSIVAFKVFPLLSIIMMYFALLIWQCARDIRHFANHTPTSRLQG